MNFGDSLEAVGKAADVCGVAVIAVGVLAAAVGSLVRFRTMPFDQTYRLLRRHVGRSILLGLELLVAADIIRTVAVRPTLESAGALGIVVLIRTVLSFSLEVELEGRWPWQASRATSAQSDGTT